LLFEKKVEDADGVSTLNELEPVSNKTSMSILKSVIEVETNTWDIKDFGGLTEFEYKVIK